MMVSAPLWGMVLVAGVAGVAALACIVAAVRMLLRPGERDPRHVKYQILRPDR